MCFLEKLVKHLGPAAEENNEFLVHAKEQLAGMNVKVVNAVTAVAWAVAASDDYDAKVQLLSDLMQEVTATGPLCSACDVCCCPDTWEFGPEMGLL